MLKYVNYDIVFQEYPDEVTLAINLALCPNRCPGCHSEYLWEDVGEELTEARLLALADHYKGEITCVGFMGGDNDPDEVLRLAQVLKNNNSDIKVGWYSGHKRLPKCMTTDTTAVLAPCENPEVLDTILSPEAALAMNYIKVGGWKEEFGPLKSKTTNQRLYRIEDRKMKDITARFWR